jgi:hypothetical protein
MKLNQSSALVMTIEEYHLTEQRHTQHCRLCLTTLEHFEVRPERLAVEALQICNSRLQYWVEQSVGNENV